MTSIAATEGHLDELAAYFTGELAGHMGLRSWLGPMTTYQTSIQSGVSPEGLAGRALGAAQVTGRVEAALERLDVPQRAVLAAYYGPHGPQAPWGLSTHGPIALVACVLEHPDRLRLLSDCASSKSPCKSTAKLALRRILARAQKALELAQQAYVEAAELERDERRRERRERLARRGGRR